MDSSKSASSPSTPGNNRKTAATTPTGKGTSSTTPSTLYRSRVQFTQSSFLTPTRTVHKLASPVMSSMDKESFGLKDLLVPPQEEAEKKKESPREANDTLSLLTRQMGRMVETVQRLERRSQSLEKLVHTLQHDRTRSNLKLLAIVAIIVLMILRRNQGK